MPEVKRLYRDCRAVYDSLPLRLGGEYGGLGEHSRNILDAYLGPIKVMSLYRHENLRLERLALYLRAANEGARPPGGEARIMVYAEPSLWSHGRLTLGGTEAEARHILDIIVRRRDVSGR